MEQRRYFAGILRTFGLYETEAFEEADHYREETDVSTDWSNHEAHDLCMAGHAANW